ncbi:hypothetical protein MJD09_17980, partial [bacterium]|nr:hypothetical protein [bacterium]
MTSLSRTMRLFLPNLFVMGHIFFAPIWTSKAEYVYSATLIQPASQSKETPRITLSLSGVSLKNTLELLTNRLGKNLLL